MKTNVSLNIALNETNALPRNIGEFAQDMGTGKKRGELCMIGGVVCTRTAVTKSLSPGSDGGLP